MVSHHSGQGAPLGPCHATWPGGTIFGSTALTKPLDLAPQPWARRHAGTDRSCSSPRNSFAHCVPWKSFSPLQRRSRQRRAATPRALTRSRRNATAPVPQVVTAPMRSAMPWTQPGAQRGRSGGRFGSNHSATDRRRRHPGGGREVVRVMAGDSETEVFRTQFLRHLRELGAAWQRRLGPVRPKRLRRHPEGVGGGGRRDDPYHLRPAPRRTLSAPGSTPSPTCSADSPRRSK